MRILLATSLFVLLASPWCLGQEPVPILKATWQRATVPAAKIPVTPTVPAKPIIAENKNFQRNARAQRTDNPMDPYEASIEGRSAAMERNVQAARAPQPDDATGYSYAAEVRNDTGKTVAIIFWEYQFTEIAQPMNIVKRQFLCGVKLKNGDRQLLSVFSLLGPSDVIDAESLAKSNTKLFEEKVVVNRIEFSDGAILQRHGWKYEDVKDAVKRATSAPWGNETCRSL